MATSPANTTDNGPGMSAVDFDDMRRNCAVACGLLKGLANEHRLMVLCALADGELSVGELNQRVPLSQSALSQHLAVLRQQNLVQTRRESQTIFYSVTSQPAIDIIAILHGAFCSQ